MVRPPEQRLLTEANGAAAYARNDSNPLNVKSFGAVGDGITDDTAAIQAAVNASENVLLPRGHTFLVSAPIRKLTGNLRLTGRGATIKLAATFPAQTGEKGVIESNNADDVYIAGLKIEGNSSALNGGAGFPDWSNFIEGILVHNAGRVMIEGCIITNFPSIGINVRLSEDVTVQHNTISNGMFHGIFSTGNDRALIFNNTIIGRGDQGTNPIIGGIGILGQKTNEIEIASNRIYNTADTGSKTEGCNDVKYVNNLVEDAGKDGLKAGGHVDVPLVERIYFAGNTVRRVNAWRPDGSMLLGGGDCISATYLGNTLEGGGTRAEDAIRMGHMHTTAGTIDRVTIANNVCRNIAAAMVRCNEAVNRITITGNEGDGYITTPGATVAVVTSNHVHNAGTLDTINGGILLQGIQNRCLVSNNVVGDYKNAVTVTAAGGAAVEAIQISKNLASKTYGDDCIRVDNFSGVAATINALQIEGNTINDPALGKVCDYGIRVGTTNLTIRAAAVTSNVVDNINGTNAVTAAFGFTGTVGAVGVANVHGNTGNGNVTNKVVPNGQNIPLRFIGLQYGSAPTWGTWDRGDVVMNAFPSAGAAPGWVCVTAGTPGAWKAMASVAA